MKRRFEVKLVIDVDESDPWNYADPALWDWATLLDLPDRDDVVSVMATNVEVRT